MRGSVFSAVVALFCGAAFGGETTVYGLRTDRLVEAAHLGKRPVFSWKLAADRRGAKQVAYRVRVSEATGRTVWDSGEVSGADSLAVPYRGETLTDCSRYRWRVEVRDETGTWTKSGDATFTTGFLRDDFWNGSAWITPAETNDSQTAVFRKAIGIEKPVREAFWCMSGLGVFEAQVNGRSVGHDVLKPGFTEAEKCRHAFTYDVTSLLDASVGATNVLSASVSCGWWCDDLRGAKGANRGQKRFFPTVPGFRAQLLIRYADGTEGRFGTGTDWDAAYSGPVIRAGIWEGEFHDARRTPDGWRPAKIDDEFTGEIRNFVGPTVVHRDDLAMKPVKAYVIRGVTGSTAERFGDATVVRRYADGEMISLSEGETLVMDFGQNASAVPDFTVEGGAGIVLKVRHAEMLNEPGGDKARGNDGPGGTPYYANLRNSSACVEYTLKEGRQTYRPLHSFFGYRYAAATATGPVKILAFRSVPVTSVHAENEVGFVETTDPAVNRLIANVRWGQLSNYLSVPTDCPQRDERLGWTGDTQAFAATATRNAEVYGFLRKWLVDLRDGQMTNGAYCCVAPDGRNKHVGAMAGWCDAGVIVPYVLWTRYGDLSAVEDGWESMCRYMDHLDRHEGHDRHNFGDWLAYEHQCKGKDIHNQPLDYKKCLSTFYWIWDAMMMREMAEALGKGADAAHYRETERRARELYGKKYQDGSGVIREDFRGQTTSLFQLKLGLCPDVWSKLAVRRCLERDIRAHGDCLQTGFLGTSILLDTLDEEGSMPEVAWTLLLQRKDPSWLYSVDQGATTVWERWNSYTKASGFGPVAMNSFNHYAYGSVLEWIYAGAAGIRPDAKAPGYRHFILKPRPDRRMRGVTAKFESPVGRIESAWRFEGGDWRWRFTIPANASATVIPPCGKSGEYESGTYEVVLPADFSMTSSAGTPPARPWRMVNLDNDFYFVYAKSPDDITEKAFTDYIDCVIGGGKVTHCCLCVCGQRTSYASKVWDPIWEGIGEPDQNGRTNSQWCAYAKLAHERGLDPWAIWIRRCRQKGVAPFVSMRMNDVHYTDQPVHFRHRKFWREHPEFRRIPGAVPQKGRPWNDYALDYTHPEVREDALDMVGEILRRWDADGIELDWMRFSLHLTRDHDTENAWALTEFMRRVRDLVSQAERERDHRISVAVRVPSTWGSAQGLGYDIGTWAKEGLSDIVIPCNTYSCSDFDMDLPEWRRRIAEANPKTAVVPGTDICISCDWRVKPYYMSQLPFFYGWCALYGRDNPDGIYLFNLPHARELWPDVCSGDLSPAALASCPRRFPVTWHDNGFQSRNRNWRQLPRKFVSPLTLKVYAAKGALDTVATAIVSFDAKNPPDAVSVSLNGVPAAQPLERLRELGNYGRNAGSAFRAEFPIAALRDGENELTVTGREGTQTEVVWAEISLGNERREIVLWPDGTMPCKRGNPSPESMSERSRDHVWIRYNVSKPTVTFFPAQTGGNGRPALVVCPGGGYGALAWNKEGTEIAEWLNANGYAAFLLKYRVPKNPDGAFCDIQRAMGIIRQRAAEFGIDPNRLGVIGFSAGGNLAARVSCDFRKRAYAPMDAADGFPCRPDFTVLVYPWALVKGEDSEPVLPLDLRPEFPVASGLPPAFVVQAEDDPFHVENAKAYAAALKRAGIPSELHLYEKGSHGFGLRNSKSPVGEWPKLAVSWLRRTVESGKMKNGR